MAFQTPMTLRPKGEDFVQTCPILRPLQGYRRKLRGAVVCVADAGGTSWISADIRRTVKIRALELQWILEYG
jgi:hypothetical protein